MLLAEWLGGPVLGAPFFHINSISNSVAFISEISLVPARI